MGLSSGGGLYWLKHWEFSSSSVVGILLPLVLLEALFGRQFSWWKVTFFFVFLSFGSLG
jgi:hypothetical protein